MNLEDLVEAGRELDERKKRRILERYTRRRAELYGVVQSVRSITIGRRRLSRLIGNIERLRRVDPGLAKGLGRVVEEYRSFKITYPAARRIIEERLRKAGLEWRD